MNRLAQSVILAWGWRRWLMAFVAGALGALAMPPFGVLPALVLGLTVAVWLLDGAVGEGRAPRRGAVLSAAVAGWWWGFGYFVAGRWEEHTSELQSLTNLVCRLLLEKKN